MAAEISIRQLMKFIESLPSDRPVNYPRKRYSTQKEHWLGWLREYYGAGFYGRQVGKKRNARLVYNRIVDPLMLLWLIRSAGIRRELVKEARLAVANLPTMPQQSAAVRKYVPWEFIAARIIKAPR